MYKFSFTGCLMLAASLLPLLIIGAFALIPLLGSSSDELDSEGDSAGNSDNFEGDDSNDATLASDGGDPEGATLTPANGTAPARLDGTEDDDAIVVEPTSTEAFEIHAYEGEDTVSAGLFQDTFTRGDDDVDSVTYTIGAAEIVADNPEEDTERGSEKGFYAAMDPEDTLTINLEEDVSGSLHVIAYELATTNEETESARIDYSIGIYLLPEGIEPPDDATDGSTLQGEVNGDEDSLMDAFGLIKLGQIDMGVFSSNKDETTGENVVNIDTVQDVPPTILANRMITFSEADFY